MNRVVFLSASIPDARRDKRYATSADLVAIRDAVRALASVALPNGTLVWGGHPAITPLVRVVAEGLQLTTEPHVVLYQSAFYRRRPKDNKAFEKVIVVPAVKRDKDASLAKMRERMISGHKFDVGFFIGGMKGVEEEHRLFRKLHPSAPAYPVASTGAAALSLFEERRDDLPDALVSDLAYPTLFREFLGEPSAGH